MRFNVKDVILDLMVEKDISLSDLSRSLNIEYKNLSNYVKGIYCPNLKNAIKIADFFNCSLNYLAGLTDSEIFGSYSSPDFKFYERYKLITKERKISHYKLCKSTGINRNDSMKWKVGAIPTFYNLIKIAEYLDVSIDYLIGRNPNKNK